MIIYALKGYNTLTMGTAHHKKTESLTSPERAY